MIGFDPGLAAMGWGVIDIARPQRPTLVRAGVVTTKRCSAREVDDSTARLIAVGDFIEAILDEHAPDECAIEAFVSYGKHVTSSLQLAAVVGMLVEACRRRKIPTAQYRAVDVASGVAGSARASKEDRERAVRMMLRQAVPIRPDHAADALAVALLHIPACGVRRSAGTREPCA